MRRLLPLLVLAAALALGATARAPAAGRPLLHVTVNPFTVSGRGFYPRERVTVVVLAKGSLARTLTASAAGSFVLRLPTLRLSRCDPYVVRATGNRGSRVLVKSPRDCPPID